MRQRLVHPEFVGRADIAPERRAAVRVDQFDDGVPVNGGGNGLAEFQVARTMTAWAESASGRFD